MTELEKQLFEAVKDNLLLKVYELVRQKKVDVNVKDEKGNTSLFYAIEEGNLEMVKFFREEGANLNTVNNNNKTPLKITKKAKKNKNKIIKYLERYGAFN